MTRDDLFALAKKTGWKPGKPMTPYMRGKVEAALRPPSPTARSRSHRVSHLTPRPTSGGFGSFATPRPSAKPSPTGFGSVR